MENNRKHKKTSSSWQIERLDPNNVPWYGGKTLLEHKTRYEFAKRFVKGGIVVELGCGSGFGAHILAKAGVQHLYAIDIDFNAVKYAKKHYPYEKITYLVRDAADTKLPSFCADAIVCFETIEHLEDINSLLREVHRLLKAKGVLILSTPNKEVSFEDNPYHLKEYTFDELNDALVRSYRVKFYGQRKVNKQLMKIYKQILKLVQLPLLGLILRFRPWENCEIHKLQNMSDNSYLYLLAICQKK